MNEILLKIKTDLYRYSFLVKYLKITILNRCFINLFFKFAQETGSH